MRRRREQGLRVLGLDLSLVTPGVVYLDGDAPTPMDVRAGERRGEERIVWLRDQITGLARPEVPVAMEDFAFTRAERAHEIGGLAYVVRIALAESGVPVLLVPVSALKKYVTGKGNASKQEVAVGVYKRWGFEHRSDDVVDAYAVARCGQLWYAERNKREDELVAKMRAVTL